MADINGAAVEAAKKRVEALVPGAKLKFFVRTNLAHILPISFRFMERI